LTGRKTNLRKLALSLLTEYEELGKYVNLSLSSHKTDGLSREERSFLAALVYTAVEHKLTYDYYISALSGRGIEKIDKTTKNILRLGLCQLLDMKGVPPFAAINETVTLARNVGERSFVNGILRTADRRRDSLPLPSGTGARHLSVKYSFPVWIVKRFTELFGSLEAEELLKKFNTVPPTDLTVNTNKISREDFAKKLVSSGYSVELSEMSPLTVRVTGSVVPSELIGYTEGEFFVQDTASAIAALTLGARPGDRVIDVCAAPGGKSFAAAITMQGKGDVTAFDIHESKLSLIESGAKRLGLSVKTGTQDARSPRRELFGTADRVICDALCSGLGVLWKKPDLRYKSEESVRELPALQYEILTASSEYLKVGGRMVYSTCTLLPEENGEVVDRFLKEHEGFRAVDFSVGNYKSEGGKLTFYPHVHGTDGFFISLVERIF